MQLYSKKVLILVIIGHPFISDTEGLFEQQIQMFLMFDQQPACDW